MWVRPDPRDPFRQLTSAVWAAFPKCPPYAGGPGLCALLTRFIYGDGLLGGAALLDLPEPPTAIFAGSDEVALGIIEAARARGLRIPEDLSLVGFDDTQVARLASPQLTTVRQPLQEMGAVALRTALRLAAGEKVDSHHVELATKLVVRDSSAAPAQLSSAAS